MDGNAPLRRNITAVAATDTRLATLLASTKPSSRVRCKPARDGTPVPRIVHEGREYPLHSTVAPLREGERYSQQVPNGGFVIALGLGAGYHLRALMERSDISGICILEPDPGVVRAVFEHVDLSAIIQDTRVSLLVEDPWVFDLSLLSGAYHPAIDGPLTLLPLRPREQTDLKAFSAFRAAVNHIIDEYRVDLSTQTRFARRWTTNLLANLAFTPPSQGVSAIRPAAVVIAAGPSLDSRVPLLRTLSRVATLISTDTALPALIRRDVLPHLVVSVDCQHISYHHFLSAGPVPVPRVLDLSSPPALSRTSCISAYVAGGHPLSRYFSRSFPGIPEIDTSGGNVTHAAVSFASAMGAEEILVLGADFSYPRGALYVRGSYVSDFFSARSYRTKTTESMTADFLFSKDLSIDLDVDGNRVYSTDLMRSYRTRLHAAAERLPARVVFDEQPSSPAASPGTGVFRTQYSEETPPLVVEATAQSSHEAKNRAREALRVFYRTLTELPTPTEPIRSYLTKLSAERRDAVLSLLPLSVAFSRTVPAAKNASESLRAAIEWTARAAFRYERSPG